MKHILNMSETPIACWTLAGKESGVPTSHGILDQALKETVDNDACPAWIGNRLHVVESCTGTQYIELPALLDRSRRAQRTIVPNPYYQSTQIGVGGAPDGRLVQDLDVDSKTTRHWGTILHQCVESTRTSSLSNNNMAIEGAR